MPVEAQLGRDKEPQPTASGEAPTWLGGTPAKPSNQTKLPQLTLVSLLRLSKDAEDLVSFRPPFFLVEADRPRELSFVTMEIRPNVVHNRDAATSMVSGRAAEALGEFGFAIHDNYAAVRQKQGQGCSTDGK